MRSMSCPMGYFCPNGTAAIDVKTENALVTMLYSVFTSDTLFYINESEIPADIDPPFMNITLDLTEHSLDRAFFRDKFGIAPEEYFNDAQRQYVVSDELLK